MNFILFFLALAVLPSAQASTFIDNGGGMAEMQFMSAVEDFGAFGICERLSNHCLLDGSELSALKLALSRPLPKITFSKIPGKEAFIYLNPTSLQITESALYQRDNVPLNFDTIAHLAYRALMKPVTDTENAIAEKLSQQFSRAPTQVYFGAFRELSVELQWIKNLAPLSDGLFFGFKGETQDLRSLFLQSTASCAWPTQFNIQRLQFNGQLYDKIRIRGRVERQCAGAKVQGDFELLVRMNDKEEVSRDLQISAEEKQ
ncbi:MAG: hypothetical protein ACXWQO_03415 [Bdellovibrionota bacterium]